MAKTNNLTDFLKDLADGIRYALTGTTAGATINPQSFRSKITEIYNKGKLDGKPNFGSNKAVQASDVRSVDDDGKALYYYDKTQDKVTQGGMTVTKAKSYNGSKVQQTISGNTYLSGDIKINSVSGSNIKPEYIKKDIYVRVGSGGNTLYDATGTYDPILGFFKQDQHQNQAVKISAKLPKGGKVRVIQSVVGDSYCGGFGVGDSASSCKTAYDNQTQGASTPKGTERQYTLVYTAKEGQPLYVWIDGINANRSCWLSVFFEQ